MSLHCSALKRSRPERSATHQSPPGYTTVRLRPLCFEAHPLPRGQRLITRISEHGGAFVPHLDTCSLAVGDLQRIVFTNALVAGWRPAEQPFMTAIVKLKDEPGGTRYDAHVMHKTNSDRDMHEKLGFFDGWGTVIAQLAERVERLS